MVVTQTIFGEVDQKTIYSFTMENDHGMKVTAINYGCIITSILAPDKKGTFEEVVIGHDALDDYIHDSYFLGAVVGRVGGRIKDGSFELDGNTYTLPTNNHKNHLHGGFKGFNKVVWDAERLEKGVRFSYFSPDGEEGYPGNLHIQVTYILDNQNQLNIHYEAHSDQKTLLTVTNHSYFNLSGNLKRDIRQHSLKIKSDRFLELNDEFIPTGNFLEVSCTPFDFRDERAIETGITSAHDQNILVGFGYDHPFILNTNHNTEMVLKDPISGRILTIETDEVGVVLYSGNSIKNEGQFRGIPARKYLGICLETQGLPDAIHHPSFPKVILDKDQKYSSKTIYKFEIGH
ncbi:galactose mutarotase [Robertmurraya korlensis]|uniref:aldose epimerase family protein n=1 Tax=Robertmurraya korlensis TaxID=519977 RepID=UPI00203DACD8|nr:aldose epimerase family protein [Robertmurraya korlensis]MCM3600456.1 galactose mutarotase [Robertmurraya korlensis]